MSSPDQDAPRPPDWAMPTPSGAPSGPPKAPPVPGTGWGPAPVAGPGPSGGYGGPVPPTGPAQPGAWGYGQVPPPGQGGWRPQAARPGIIPLRPLGVWEIFDGAFGAIRANPRVMFGLSALVVTVVVALQSLSTWYLGRVFAPWVDDLTGTMDPDGEFGLADSAGATLGLVVTAPFVLIATTVLTGLLIVSVSRSVIGRTSSVREVTQLARHRIWWVLGFTVLLTLGSVVVTAGFVAAIWALGSSGQEGAAVAFALLGGAALTVGAVWVMVRTLLVPPALMLEGAPFWATVRRAWRLSRGSFWRLLGIYLLVGLVTTIVAWAIGAAVGVLQLLLGAVFATDSFATLLATAVGDALAQILSTVFTAAVVALLYIDVRMRREGLDVELARAADETPA